MIIYVGKVATISRVPYCCEFRHLSRTGEIRVDGRGFGNWSQADRDGMYRWTKLTPWSFLSCIPGWKFGMLASLLLGWLESLPAWRPASFFENTARTRRSGLQAAAAFNRFASRRRGRPDQVRRCVAISSVHAHDTSAGGGSPRSQGVTQPLREPPGSSAGHAT
eukprot:scaffold462_cov195-Pinguiococcus_pyrenoidosus.AAC.101